MSAYTANVPPYLLLDDFRHNNVMEQYNELILTEDNGPEAFAHPWMVSGAALAWLRVIT